MRVFIASIKNKSVVATDQTRFRFFSMVTFNAYNCVIIYYISVITCFENKIKLYHNSRSQWLMVGR